MEFIAREQQVVQWMIELYCQKRHHSQSLCNECRELADYAQKRLLHCKFGNNKPTCKKCPIHCYAPEMREKIRNVMRFSGPRLIWHHPIAAIRHLLANKRQ